MCRSRCARLQVAAAWVAGLMSLTSSCSLLVEVPEPLPPLEVPSDVEPLSAGEKTRFLFDNLGELAPGIAYRSHEPSRALLEFLSERVNLGEILDLQRKPDPDEKAFIEARSGTYTHVRMSAARPPTPRKILEMIRVTLRAQESRRPFLMHCRAGADRTGMMSAAWRMLFQGVKDRERLKRETSYHFHIPPVYPNVFQFIDLFPVELYRPFIDNPGLLDDEERIRELEERVFTMYPLVSGSTRTRRGSLRAGVGKRNLLDGWTGPVQLATYGPSPGVAAGVRTPVFARAIALEVDDLRVAVVSADLLITDAELRRLVAVRLGERGVELDDLLVAATHTHTSVGGFVDHGLYEFYMFGPFQEELRSQLVTRIADAVVDAVNALEPAAIGAGSAAAGGLSANRRHGTTVDPEVGILKVVDAAGDPIAVVVNFAAHPILSPADGFVSPDYPGHLASKLDDTFGFGLFLAGALGDLNAVSPRRPGQWASEGLAEEVAAELFTAVRGHIDSIATRSDVELGAMTTYFALPPFNPNLIPDLLFPLDWLVGSLIDWPKYAPLQTLRIGDTAIVATSSEIAVRLGLDLKQRSPAASTFVVTHANAYSGYAVTQANHARSKLDPTSFVALNGPAHGAKTVEQGLDMLEHFWSGEATAPAAVTMARPYDRSERAAPRYAGLEPTPYGSPTGPQSRRFGQQILDTVPDRVRFESSFWYRDRLGGGDGARGRLRDVTLRAAVRGPWEIELDAAGGYRRADWKVAGVRGSDEGVRDLEFGVQRPFLLAASETEGDALRLIPRLATTAPTANAASAAPFAFARGSGVWRPTAGGALELTWNTYRALTLETLYTTAIDRHQGRRPGDLWESALTYSERHGHVSLFLGARGLLKAKDRRSSGRTPVDVDQASFDLVLRPGASLHLTDQIEAFVRGDIPLLKTGSGAGAGRGIMTGLLIGF